jgi:hypothetical protein
MRVCAHAISLARVFKKLNKKNEWHLKNNLNQNIYSSPCLRKVLSSVNLDTTSIKHINIIRKNTDVAKAGKIRNSTILMTKINIDEA